MSSRSSSSSLPAMHARPRFIACVGAVSVRLGFGLVLWQVEPQGDAVCTTMPVQVMDVYQPGAIVVCGGADSLSGDRLGCFNLSLQVQKPRSSAARAALCPVLLQVLHFVRPLHVFAAFAVTIWGVDCFRVSEPYAKSMLFSGPGCHCVSALVRAGACQLHAVPGRLWRAHAGAGRGRLHHAQRRALLVLRDRPPARPGAARRVRSPLCSFLYTSPNGVCAGMLLAVVIANPAVWQFSKNRTGCAWLCCCLSVCRVMSSRVHAVLLWAIVTTCCKQALLGGNAYLVGRCGAHDTFMRYAVQHLSGATA